MSSSERSKALALQNGWSLLFANGYADGEATRSRKTAVPVYISVARDEYAEGFRAGFYGRVSSRPAVQLHSVSVARAA